MPSVRFALLAVVAVAATAGSAACSKSESRFTAGPESPNAGVVRGKTTDELTPE